MCYVSDAINIYWYYMILNFVGLLSLYYFWTR